MKHDDGWVAFDVPRDWENRTVVAYAAPDDGAGNIVIARDRRADDESLYDYADRHLDTLSRRLDGFNVRGHDETSVGDRPALSISFTSDKGDTLLVQRLLLVDLGDGELAAITLTAASENLGQVVPLFERIVASVTFAKRSPAT